MPWSIEHIKGKWCVKAESGQTEGCHDSRTDAIKQQRALYAAEKKISMVAALTYVEPVIEEDTRLEEALARLDELAQKEEKREHLQITVGQDAAVMDALLSTINQISERLENGERVTESLVASLRMMADQPAPVVNVNVPEQAAPIVNVAAPLIPDIHIPEIKVPDIHVPPSEVTVMLPERQQKISFTRDPIDGKLQGAEITEE